MTQGQVPVLPQYGARDVLMLRSRATPGATSGDHHKIQDPSKALADRKGAAGKMGSKVPNHVKAIRLRPSAVLLLLQEPSG